ncbi:MAG: A/G-specific adenine glycosylase [Nitrospinae bacterium CG11_big_fil_rev_8_21_14_0_20_56_8]|nr:MAG: A/G-specific adenine glycosylase [Nitrospinae bacterium CG11_big_fil_rev_8_21_14_0_20_56_8]
MPDKTIIRKALLTWYRKEKRDLPWRNTGDPYHIWVSEMMLQQTQVKTVIPYYQRWLETFPTVEDLAEAQSSRVLKLWEGLGYYSRARNFHAAARIVVREFGGKVPDSAEAILQLPGIGRYTAGAILSIAYDRRVPVLDGNVKRVLSRLFLIPGNRQIAGVEAVLWNKAEELLPRNHPGDFNQALMELGATVCLPKNPDCPLCPLSRVCRARKENAQAQFPASAKTTPAQKIQVSAAVIQKGGKTFIQQRPHKGLMGGLWEFPGGKLQDSESPEECIRREIREELGVDIRVGEKLMTVRHSYTQFRVTLHVFRCTLNNGRLRPTQCEQWRWVPPEDLEDYPFPAANARIVKFLKASQSAPLRGVKMKSRQE